MKYFLVLSVLFSSNFLYAAGNEPQLERTQEYTNGFTDGYNEGWLISNGAHCNIHNERINEAKKHQAEVVVSEPSVYQVGYIVGAHQGVDKGKTSDCVAK